jgi:hypothetical protein
MQFSGHLLSAKLDNCNRIRAKAVQRIDVRNRLLKSYKHSYHFNVDHDVCAKIRTAKSPSEPYMGYQLGGTALNLLSRAEFSNMASTVMRREARIVA